MEQKRRPTRDEVKQWLARTYREVVARHVEDDRVILGIWSEFVDKLLNDPDWSTEQGVR